MKKLGFTLAEVLITLAIIGVIAAMTLPALTSNVQKSQTGPALAKAVNTLENMNRNALVQYNARNLETVIKCIGTEYKIDDPTYLDLLNAQVSGAKENGSTTNYISKDGIMYIMGTFTNADGTASETPVESEWTEIQTKGADGNDVSKTADNKYYYKKLDMIIDTNGAKTPNILGDDRFLVYIDNGGAVVPSGGNEANLYSGDEIQTKDTCTSTPSEKCIGHIADNGWKVNY